MKTDNSLDSFRHSLAATTAWCAAVSDASDLSRCFRSPTLQPPIDIGEHTDSIDLIQNAVQHVIDCRFTYFATAGTEDASGTSTGRLLAFYPRVTIFDGFAAIESDGFYDPANVPPWDTWVCFVDDFLISFVPRRFTVNAECGIITNAEECIVWLRDVDHPFVHELKNHNLVA